MFGVFMFWSAFFMFILILGFVLACLIKLKTDEIGTFEFQCTWATFSQTFKDDTVI